MLNRPQEILFVTNEGRVQTNGHSLTLGKGQFGIIDKGAAKSALGEKVTTTLPQDNDRLFELVLGSSDLKVNRSQSNANWRSIPFKLSDVVSVKVKTPTNEGSVDEVLIGYDGINDDTALVFQNGDNEVLDIKLKGETIGMLGYPNGEVIVKLYLEAPNEGAFTNQEIVEKGVERLLKTTLIGGVPITQYLEITPINSEQGALSGTSYTFYELKVTNDGRESDKALVQAQYPNYKVEQVDYRNGVSTYVILAPTGTSLAAYSIPASDLVVLGCEDCPTGYTATDAGVVYKVIVNDEGVDVGDTVIDTLPGYASDEKIANENGIGTYLAVVDDALTAGEITTFITANPTASVELIGEISSVCDNNASATTIAWVAGKEGTAVAETYTLQIADDKCGENRLAEVEAAYPDLTIAVAQTGDPVADITGGCQTVYTTTVLSNPVFEECDPILLGLYFTEAPAPFGFTAWKKAAKTYDETALMGIRIKTKMMILAGDNEEYRFNLPNIYEPIRISVASETGMVNESFRSGLLGRFAVKMLSVGSTPDNLGMHLRDMEHRSFVYYTGDATHQSNNFARYILGEESLLKPLAQYVQYLVTIRTKKISGMFASEVVDNHTYVIVAENGKHKDVEGVVNALALAAGIDPVYS